MSTLSTNMNLVLPTIGVDSGLAWEQAINSNSFIIDQHNHSNGSGVQINPDGLNINAVLPFNGNNAISLRSCRFTSQVSPIVLPTDLGCIYVSGVDLYYNDVNGNAIQITSGGLVNATSSGISSGTASASFSTGVLVVNAASNTPANIRGASYVMGNTSVSGSHYLTLNPPAALANDYSITFPLAPAQTNVVTLDSSGNLASITYDSVGQNMTAVGANAIANSRTRATGTSVAAGGIALTGAITVAFITTQAAYTILTNNITLTLVCTGNAVQIVIQQIGSGAGCFVTGAGSGNGNLAVYRDGATLVGTWGYVTGSGETPGAITMVDFPTAGSHTYSVFGKTLATSIQITAYEMVVYEL